MRNSTIGRLPHRATSLNCKIFAAYSHMCNFFTFAASSQQKKNQFEQKSVVSFQTHWSCKNCVYARKSPLGCRKLPRSHICNMEINVCSTQKKHLHHKQDIYSIYRVIYGNMSQHVCSKSLIVYCMFTQHWESGNYWPSCRALTSPPCLASAMNWAGLNLVTTATSEPNLIVHGTTSFLEL